MIPLLLVLSGVTFNAAPRIDTAFWNIWGDGHAELASYKLVQPRYGHARQGTAITIFVAEPFSNSARVKADPGKHPRSDEFSVLKLNLVKKFQTGIYDYSEMTSAFVAMSGVNGRPAGSPVKTSFSSQEWCGHVYSQALFDASGIRSTRHSYFDGEADRQTTLEYPEHGIAEDALFHWARGMAGPVLQPGEKLQVQLLRGWERVRHSHKNPDWMTATLQRAASPERIRVPAGVFEVQRFSVASGDSIRTFYVESAAPHRIVRWDTSNGERAELVGSERVKYWELNKPGGETALKRLGLRPLIPPGAPPSGRSSQPGARAAN